MNHFPLFLFLCIISWPSTLIAQNPEPWKTVEIGKETYIPLKSIEKFYGFERTENSAGKIVMSRAQSGGSPFKIQFLKGQPYAWINEVKFVFSYPTRLYEKQYLLHSLDLAKIIDPVLRPYYINSDKSFDTVIIDPGHGGHDPGTISPHGFGDEKTHTLTLSKRLASHLMRRGFKVRMTRDYDLSLTLQQRVDFANLFENAIVISIHFNAGGGGTATGLETFFLAPQGVTHYGREREQADFSEQPGNQHDSANIALATAIHKTCLQNTGRRDRGIRNARYAIISRTKHPSVLIECGFLANRVEGELIADPAYQERFARSISDGVLKYKMATEKRKP